MTREEMRQRREAKKAAKLEAKRQQQEATKFEKSWNKMVERAKEKGAWIEQEEIAAQEEKKLNEGYIEFPNNQNK